MYHSKIWGIAILTCCVVGCKWRMESLPEEKQLISFKVPANFPPPVYAIANNPITNEGFELGKALFYDGILSKDGTVSCGSCHQQVAAFAHQDHALSHGIHDLIGTRNSPALMNLAWNPSFFWDGGVADLDLQPIAPIENPVEMGEKLGDVLQKLRASSKYPPLFQKAFGSAEVTTAKTMKALAQFMVMLVSANSKYDKMRRGEASLTVEENAGLQIFRQKCGSCHQGELFTDNSFANNGLPLPPPPNFNDQGRASITNLPADAFKFKVPTLRNIEKTAPYMHDGRIATLEQAIAHYPVAVATPNVDVRMRQTFGGFGVGIPLTLDERTKILSFLKTLTDQEFLTNPLFAE